MGEIGTKEDDIILRTINENPIKALNNYVNCNFNNAMGYSDIINEITKLNNILSDAHYIIESYVINDLLKYNKLLYSSIEKVFKENKNVILNGDFELLFDNSLIVNMIDAYCNINKIVIKANEDVDLSCVRDSLKQYLYDIHKFPILSQEETLLLLNKIKNGDKKARDYLINCNLKLVVNIAKRLVGNGLEIQDLIQEGTIGLSLSIDRYDETKGAKFTTYAIWWIRQTIYQSLCDKSRLIRVPSNVSLNMRRIRRTCKQLSKLLLREPTDEEIAKELNMNVSLVKKIRKIDEAVISIDAELDDEGNTVGLYLSSDSKTPEEEYEQRELELEIDRLLRTSNLSTVEQEVIKHHFGVIGYKQLSLRELGKKYNYTCENIRQIEIRSLKKMRDSEYGQDIEESWFSKRRKKKLPVIKEQPIDNKAELIDYKLLTLRKRLFNKDEVSKEEYIELLRSLDPEMLLNNIAKLNDEDKSVLSIFLKPVPKNNTIASFVMTNNKAFEEVVLKLMSLYINDCRNNSKRRVRTRV